MTQIHPPSTLPLQKSASAPPRGDAVTNSASGVFIVTIGASNQLGEFESGVTAAWLGPVGSVVLGGLGTLLVAGAWVRLFPALAQRDRLTTAVR